MTSLLTLFLSLFSRVQIVSIGSLWEESKLHEHANDYVDDFCGFLALLWRYLYASPGRLPLGILKMLWENLVGGGYMILIDGFSKVPYCSTEGRALMSMDVASYRSETSARSIANRLRENQHPSCPLPAVIEPYRSAAYVDTYVKIFYFPSKVSRDKSLPISRSILGFVCGVAVLARWVDIFSLTRYMKFI